MGSLLLPLLVIISLLVLNANGIKVRLGLHPPAVRGDEILPPDEWFIQKLDHFDPTSNKIWKQRYYTNSEYFENNKTAPVFLMIGGEAEADRKWMVGGAWLEYAKQYGALCFQLEHRYYGKSHPTEDMSVENLAFLSSEQALSDLADFIQGMNEKHGLTSSNKWVMFGGSYPGSLAAWARMKYPHLIYAAVSTSGPLLAKIDFSEYYNVVAKSLDIFKTGCANAVREATKKVIDLLQTNNGTDKIFEKFDLCSPIDPTKNDDVTNFFENLASIYSDVVQYNENNIYNPYPKESSTIHDICRVMTNPSYGDTLDRMAHLNSKRLSRLGKECLNVNYNEEISTLKDSSWEADENGNRQWLYQTCTEFGFYQTSEKSSDLFSNTIPLSWYIKQCGDIYGPWFSPKILNGNVDETNNMYGGLGLDVSRVVFVHGSIDPWHSLGRIHSTSSKSPAIYIEGTAHCTDMYPAKASDPPQLKKARKMISSFIGEWLAEGLDS